jgi:hypothetical protein
MIIDYFVKNLKFPQEYIYNNIKIIIGIKEEKKTIFKNIKYWIYIIVYDENEIIYNIKNVFEFIINIFFEKTQINKKYFIDANWYIFNNITSKNIYEKIDLKENIKYKNMYNRFILINNNTGEIFFNPGKIENNVMSDRMKLIFDSYSNEYNIDEEKEKQYSTEIMHLFDVIEVVINDSK